MPESGPSAAPGEEERFLRETVGIIDERDRGVLGLRGKGVRGFLQRLLTNDVQLLQPGRGQPSALLTGKGKLVAAFELFRKPPSSGDEERYRLVFGEPLREEVQRVLEKYALLEDIEVKDLTAAHGVIAVQGPRAEALLRGLLEGGGLPGEPLREEEVSLAGVPADCRRGGATPAGGFELQGASSELLRVLAGEARALGGGPVGSIAAESLRIEARVPRWGVDFDGQNFPNEAGWEPALSYTKGCYIGQEVIARMRTYGHLNRRLMAVDLPPGEAVPAGSPLYLGGKEAGAVTSSSPRTSGPSLALAMLRAAAFEPGARLSVGSPGGPAEVVVVGPPRLRSDPPRS